MSRSRSSKFSRPPNVCRTRPHCPGRKSSSARQKRRRMYHGGGKTVGGQLGRPSGARFRTYERLKRHADAIKGTLFDTPQLAKTIEEIYRFPAAPIRHRHADRQLRSGVSDEKLAELVIALRDDDACASFTRKSKRTNRKSSARSA